MDEELIEMYCDWLADQRLTLASVYEEDSLFFENLPSSEDTTSTSLSS